MAQDVVTLITIDHREVEHLFDRVQAGDGDMQEMVRSIYTLLFAHGRAEEDEVYPTIKEVAPDEAGEVDEGAQEHRASEVLLQRLANTDPADENFARLVAQTRNAIQHHLREEEEELLPALQRGADAARLEELGLAFSKRKLEELRTFPAETAAGTPAQDVEGEPRA